MVFLLALNQLPPDSLKDAFVRVLQAAARKLRGQAYKYPIPIRVSLPDLLDTLGQYLSSSSGGLRPLVVTTSVLTVLGECFSLFSRVESQGINTADAASGSPGDIMCYDGDDHLALAVEVKDRDLTLADIRASTRKTQQSDDQLSQLLFAVPRVRQGDYREIKAMMNSAWAAGLNLYHIDVLDLVSATFVLLNEKFRPILLREIGEELDRRGEHVHRRRWYKALVNMGEEGK